MTTEIMTTEVVAALTEKVERQDRFIKELQSELDQARNASVDTMLGQLRLRGAVLMYVGHQSVEGFERQIFEAFGAGIAGAVSTSLFVLDNAPLSPEARTMVRKAIQSGRF